MAHHGWAVETAAYRYALSTSAIPTTPDPTSMHPPARWDGQLQPPSARSAGASLHGDSPTSTSTMQPFLRPSPSAAAVTAEGQGSAFGPPGDAPTGRGLGPLATLSAVASQQADPTNSTPWNGGASLSTTTIRQLAPWAAWMAPFELPPTPRNKAPSGRDADRFGGGSNGNQQRLHSGSDASADAADDRGGKRRRLEYIHLSPVGGSEVGSLTNAHPLPRAHASATAALAAAVSPSGFFSPRPGVAAKLDLGDLDGETSREVTPAQIGTSQSRPQSAGIDVGGGGVRPETAGKRQTPNLIPASSQGARAASAAPATSPATTLSDRSGMDTQQQQQPQPRPLQQHGAPGHAPTVEPLTVLTFQTRTRGFARQLQEEAVRENRRYVPPAREVWQHIQCATIPPDGPAAMEVLELYPVLRIGDTFECRFSPATPFEVLCQGTELAAHSQSALVFESRLIEGRSEHIRQVEFETFYYSFDEGAVCMRCQRKPGACDCAYPNDLLEVNRDWQTKRNPNRRLGFRWLDDGSVSIGLRVPRIRRPLSPEEKQLGQEARTNTWNSKLRLRHAKDPKTMIIRVTEYSQAVTMAEGRVQLGPRVVASQSQGFARLIAKNSHSLRTEEALPPPPAPPQQQTALQQEPPAAAADPASDVAVVLGPAIVVSPSEVGLFWGKLNQVAFAHLKHVADTVALMQAEAAVAMPSSPARAAASQEPPRSDLGKLKQMKTLLSMERTSWYSQNRRNTIPFHLQVFNTLGSEISQMLMRQLAIVQR